MARRQAARVLGVESAEIDLGRAGRTAEPGRAESARGRRTGRRHDLHAAWAPIRIWPSAARFLPALAALLAVAIDRSRLEREALEAETLRRSDLVKTALLRAVSRTIFARR